MAVLDANILVRAVLGHRVRHLLETYVAKGVRFFAPKSVFTEATQHLPSLLAKRGGEVADVIAAIGYIRTMVEVVDPGFYGIFEAEARERLRKRDIDDWPVLATALGLGCPI